VRAASVGGDLDDPERSGDVITFGPQGVPAKAKAAKAGARPPVPGPGETLGGLKGARTELRNQMRSRRRLRVVTLVSLAAIVLIVLPVFFGLRSAGRDPVFSSLDALSVPSWAQTHVVDRSSGSQWCFIDCRFRERTADSSKPLKETTAAYDQALRSAGWQPWKVAECPEQPIDPASGTYTCWTRDEFTLDLQVSLPDCAVDALAAQDPAALPSAAAPPTDDPKKCVGSTVSMKVQNAITDTRGKKEPGQSPDLVGETPDPTFSDDPLLGSPTPKAS
jgi:integrin beta 3